MRLRETELLRGAAPAVLARLESLGSTRTLSQGALVCSAGDAEAPVIFVLAGTVRVYKADADGREQTMVLVGAGDVLNLPAAFAADRRAPANVAVLSLEARLASIPGRAFAEQAASDPALAMAVMSTLATQARHLSELVADLSLRSVRQRLVRFLLAQADDDVGHTPARWTHAEIATRLGTAREVVSRQLRALVQEGLISQERQRLVIADAEALRRLADS